VRTPSQGVGKAAPHTIPSEPFRPGLETPIDAVSRYSVVIAIAAVHGIGFLLTWNCVHIASAVIAKDIAKICRQYDWESSVICTPEELF
jgi:hypothetical protein